ncbi:hypothetical protein [Nannocystis pusilla]
MDPAELRRLVSNLYGKRVKSQLTTFANLSDNDLYAHALALAEIGR